MLRCKWHRLFCLSRLVVSIMSGSYPRKAWMIWFQASRVERLSSFSCSEKCQKYRRRGQSLSGIIDGVYKGQNLLWNVPHNDSPWMGQNLLLFVFASLPSLWQVCDSQTSCGVTKYQEAASVIAFDPQGNQVFVPDLVWCKYSIRSRLKAALYKVSK